MVAPRTDVDISQYVTNINWNAGEWQRYINAPGRSFGALDDDIEEAIHNTLVSNFARAMDEIEEYQEGPLREHLLNMLMNYNHVYVTAGKINRIFDINYAGNYEDVVAGQIAAGADFSIPPDKRSAGWEIIYNMANHGMAAPKSVADRYSEETYGEIIQRRISFWGEKAPYWIFVEFGTAGAGSGPGTPYPSFSGRGPLYQTQQQAESIARTLTEAWLDTVDETLSSHVTQVFVDDRLSIGYIDNEVGRAWTRSFRRGQRIVQLEQLRGRFTGRYRIIGPAE